MFHDSCGFEAGSDYELHKVQSFIEERANEQAPEARLHAIWFNSMSRGCVTLILLRVTTGIALQWRTIQGQLLWLRKFSSQSVDLERVKGLLIHDTC